MRPISSTRIETSVGIPVESRVFALAPSEELGRTGTEPAYGQVWAEGPPLLREPQGGQRAGYAVPQSSQLGQVPAQSDPEYPGRASLREEPRRAEADLEGAEGAYRGGEGFDDRADRVRPNISKEAQREVDRLGPGESEAGRTVRAQLTDQTGQLALHRG